MSDPIDGPAGLDSLMTATANGGVSHPWNVSARQAIALQQYLACRVVCTPKFGWQPTVVAGVDVTPRPDAPELFVAGVVAMRVADLAVVSCATAQHPAMMPYIPGLLSFREGPAIMAAVDQLACDVDLLIFDGQGLAHPRRCGIACHLGVLWNRPTVGCGKTRLCGDHAPVGPKRGQQADLTDRGEVIGRVVRTRSDVAELYISVGHLIDLAGAVAVALSLAWRYRLPEPIRLAHHLVNAVCGRRRHWPPELASYQHLVSSQYGLGGQPQIRLRS